MGLLLQTTELPDVNFPWISFSIITIIAIFLFGAIINNWYRGNE